MSRLLFITHTDIELDPNIPVPQWQLNERGRTRAAWLADQPLLDGVDRLLCSSEVKAIETAGIISEARGLTVEMRPDLGENVRTKFVPPDEFEVLADAFFSNPEESVEGWERAVDAQARIVAATADLLDDDAAGDIAVIAHGGVGTLLYCHLAGLPISRDFDQPNQGSWFAIDRATKEPDGPLRSID